MPVKSAKGAKKKADELFSLIIRSTMYCERCGVHCPCSNAPKRHSKGCPLTTSHIIPRTPSWTRTLEENAQCLCFKCHAFFTTNPVRFTEWLDETIGREEFYRLEAIARRGTTKKFDWDTEVERLTKIYNAMLAGEWQRKSTSGNSLV